MQADETNTSEVSVARNRKRFLLVVFYVAVTMIWVAPAAQRTLSTGSNSPLEWVDDRFEPRRDYDEFCDDFGASDTVVISWPGCTIDDASLDAFVHSLRDASAFQTDGQPLFHQVLSGREMMLEMTSPPLQLSRQQAVHRLSKSLIGPDGATTCVVIGFAEQALQERSRLVPLIQASALKNCGVQPDDQHLAGPIMDGYEVDRATTNTIQMMGPLSSCLVFLICFLCLDSLGATLLVFGVSLLCQVITLAMVDLTAGTMTALMAVLAPLIQVLAIAGGIHFINYYLDAIRTGDSPSKAVSHAFSVAWLPCSLSSLTTAIGLGSLAVSGLVAVRQFGGYSAFGVIITVIALLTFLPGSLLIKPIRQPRSNSRFVPTRLWGRYADAIERHAAFISLFAFLLMVGMGIGITQLNASVRIETLFSPDSRLVSDYRWIEANVGALVPIEVVVSFTPEDANDPSQTLDRLTEIKTHLEAIPQVESVISAITFSPSRTASAEIPIDWQTDLNNDQLRLELVRGIASEQNLCRTEENGVTRWRTTAYVSALGGNDYLQIINRVEAALAETGRGQLKISGLMPLVHGIQQRLMNDLFESFLLAFGLIAMVMIVIQAGVIPGLLSMVPNVFPALTLFGLLGWLGHPLDVGSIMTASVAMGIAVDDTLHYLTFYQRGIDSGASRQQAVRLAYQHCGPAMIQTTVICGGGLSIFIFSDFVPTSGFAWMSVVLLSAALIGDLLILPAMLLSPLGRFSTSRKLEQETLDTKHTNAR
ncbi:efflux RND transporter permease subunit [Rhodopirellula sp. MGV]|uniref:efflux RND transporter permease subunit n=1 Tax=Rhodopirellula sp. MGV TaxID=2023130 RepID=UPI000B96BCD2|nr:MMPL family transporter [Rhodopirellula sp. MGV]OYP33940.1 hypothetical protein CGZ80_17325 [Rhodopirellula sp. MGV]PNY34079.1 hypothetical protein C2E31_25070 [Rhodopirellula baltica]